MISKIKPFGIHVNGPRHFDKKVIYLEVEKTKELIQISKRINRFLKVHCHDLLEDYRPGNWIPHITLAMDDLSKRNFQKACAELKDTRIEFRQKLHNVCIVQQYLDGKIRIGKRYEL